MKKLVLAAIAPVLFGCNSGIGYVAANYGVQVGEVIATKHGEFKIWDKPDQSKMLVSPTVSEILVHPEIAKGDAISMEGGPDEQAARSAADTWFERAARHCKVIAAAQVARPEYEITYSCG